MNGMGGDNRLQSMVAGLMGQSNPNEGPPTSGPTAQAPTGYQQPVDQAYPWFIKMKGGLNALAQALEQLGDQVSANQVQELAVELGKIGEARSNDLLKKQQLDQRLGQANDLLGAQGGY